MANPQAWDADRALTKIRELEHLPGALLPILHALQDEFGYVDKAAVPLIADALNLSHAEVHGVISFYHDFRHSPPGRHILKMCRAEACQSMGCESMIRHVEDRLGVEAGRNDGRSQLHGGSGLLSGQLRPLSGGDARRQAYGRVSRKWPIF